jgi:PST family polysaccharide transporter
MRVGTQYILRLGSAAVLARILTPEDYGLFGMAAVVIAFLLTFADAGLGLATIQRKNLSEQQFHNLFWFNFAFGSVLCLVTVGSAPLVADFFHRQELGRLLATLAIGFILGGIAVQPAALLRRAIQTRKIVIIDLLAEILGYAVAVFMAWRGAGFWALAGHSLSSAGLRTLLLMIGARYWPRLPARATGTHDLLRFGGYVGAFAVVNYFARNMDNVLIGRILGADELGFYSRAWFLMTVPTLLVTGSLSEVMIPSLSALQNEKRKFENAYRKALVAIASVASPMALGMVVTAPGLVRAIYGETWMPVARLLQLLGIAAVFQPLVSTSGWLYGALGRGREMFVVGTTFSIFLVTSFVIGIRWGAVGVAGAYAVANLVLAFPAMLIAHRVAGVSIRPTVRAVAPFLAAATLMAVVVAGVGQAAQNFQLGWLWIFILQILAGGILYPVILWFAARESVFVCLKMVRSIYSGGKREM